MNTATKGAAKRLIISIIAMAALGGCAVYGPPPGYQYSAYPATFYGQAYYGQGYYGQGPYYGGQAVYGPPVYYGPEYYGPVEVMGLYWHFVDIVWIFLFPFLYLIHGAHHG